LVSAAMAAVNNPSSSSPLDRQFAIRELGSRIAHVVFGDRLLGMVRSHLAHGGIVLWDGLPSLEMSPDSTDELTFGQTLVAVIAQGPTHSFGYQEEDNGRHFQRLFPVAGIKNGGRTPD